MDYTYKKPDYDPFEVFRPSNAYLRRIIKELKQQCYDILEINRQLKKDGLDDLLDDKLAKLHSRIRNYEFRIKQGNGQLRGNLKSITDIDIARAKQVPIPQNGFKKVGNRLVGKCPFHKEKTGSFTIYLPENRWYCFGACAQGGDMIDYTMKSNNLNFIEAVKFLRG